MQILEPRTTRLTVNGRHSRDWEVAIRRRAPGSGRAGEIDDGRWVWTGPVRRLDLEGMMDQPSWAAPSASAVRP